MKITIMAACCIAAVTAQGAVINYTQSFDLGDVASSVAELTTSGTPVQMDGGVNYPTVYEAGDYFGGALVNGGALELWCRSTGGNSVAFFDLGSALDTADGASVKVDFTAVESARNLNNGSYVISVYDGLSDVTEYSSSPSFWSVDNAPMASTTITIVDASYYIGGEHAESVTLSGLSNTSGNLYLSIMANDISGDATLGSIDNLVVTQIPEPATIGLVAAMGGGMLFVRRRFMM